MKDDEDPTLLLESKADKERGRATKVMGVPWVADVNWTFTSSFPHTHNFSRSRSGLSRCCLCRIFNADTLHSFLEHGNDTDAFEFADESEDPHTTCPVCHDCVPFNLFSLSAFLIVTKYTQIMLGVF